jgi:hypothetical protein
MAQTFREERPLSREEIREALQDLKGSDLEYFLAELWDFIGWDTQVTSHSKDRGIDVIATQVSPLPLKILIQAKGYGSSSTVSSTEVQQYSSLQQQDDEADIVAIVTTGDFSDPARQIAESLDIKLVDIHSLVGTITDKHAYELLDPYVDADISPDGGGNETDDVLAENVVFGSDHDPNEHVTEGEGLHSLVPAEEYGPDEAVSLVLSSEQPPRVTSGSKTERQEINDANELGAAPVYLHLTTDGIHLFVRSDEDRHEFLPYDSVDSARVETPLFGSMKTLLIESTGGLGIEYEYETMETEQQRRLRTVFEEALGLNPLN